MIKKGDKIQKFVSQSYNILVTLQHKRKKTKIVIPNRYVIKDLVRAGVVVYTHSQNAFVTYRYNLPAIPALKRNILRLKDGKTTH